MRRSFKKILMSVTALAALALGGSALAGAAGNSGTTTSGATTSGTSTTAPGAARGGGPGEGGFPAGEQPGTAAHENAEKAVTGQDAEKAQAAAAASISGGKAGAVTSDFRGGGYEVTVTKSDGSQVTVHLDSAFKVQTHPGGPGPGIAGGQGPNAAGPPAAGQAPPAA